MDEIHNQQGHLVAKYEKNTGLVEILDHKHRYCVNLRPGQSYRIESKDSLTVVTRLDDTAFTIDHFLHGMELF
jgi:hypothetical protein